MTGAPKADAEAASLATSVRRLPSKTLRTGSRAASVPRASGPTHPPGSGVATFTLSAKGAPKSSSRSSGKGRCHARCHTRICQPSTQHAPATRRQTQHCRPQAAEAARRTAGVVLRRNLAQSLRAFPERQRLKQRRLSLALRRHVPRRPGVARRPTEAAGCAQCRARRSTCRPPCAPAPARCPACAPRPPRRRAPAPRGRPGVRPSRGLAEAATKQR